MFHNIQNIFNKKDHLLLFSFDSIHHWHELKYSHLFWNLLVLLTLNSHYIINNQIKIFNKVLQRLNFFLFFLFFLTVYFATKLVTYLFDSSVGQCTCKTCRCLASSIFLVSTQTEMKRPTS